MVIKPEAIPQFSGDLGVVEAHAASLHSAGGDFRLTGQDVHSTWQGLAAFYEAPEAATLFGATLKVRTDADKVGDDVQEVGAALTQYVQVMRPIVARLASLKSEAGTFVAGIKDDEDWRADEGKVNRNNDLIRQVDTQLAAMMAAERQAANRINRLFGGTQWVVGDGSGSPNGYGFDAGKLPAEADRPWGSSEERDLPWYQDTWNFVTGEYVGFFGDGFWGDVTGLVGLINPFDWETFSASWGGLWTLTGGVFFDPGKTGNAWKEFGKSLLAWDTWSEDPGRAFGNVLYNVVTLPLAPLKVGLVGKGGKGAAAAADVGKGADAGKAAELAAAGRVLDEFGDVADIGKVDGLPTVGDLAKQIDLHLGDVLKQNPDLQRALQDADALARVDVPEAPARVAEPALVGAGRTGGTDLAPPPRTGGTDIPPTPGRGGEPGLPDNPGRGGGSDVPLTPGRGTDLPGGPGRGGEPDLPDNPGRGGDAPTNPGRTADVPDTPGRTADGPDTPGRRVDEPVNPGHRVDEPVNPGRTADDPTGPDRGSRDTPSDPTDDAPGRPGTPADDAPGPPNRTPDDTPGHQDRPGGDRPPAEIRADLDSTGRGGDDAADTGRGAEDADGDAGRTTDAGDSPDPQRPQNDPDLDKHDPATLEEIQKARKHVADRLQEMSDEAWDYVEQNKDTLLQREGYQRQYEELLKSYPEDVARDILERMALGTEAHSHLARAIRAEAADMLDESTGFRLRSEIGFDAAGAETPRVREQAIRPDVILEREVRDPLTGDLEWEVVHAYDLKTGLKTGIKPSWSAQVKQLLDPPDPPEELRPTQRPLGG